MYNVICMLLGKIFVKHTETKKKRFKYLYKRVEMLHLRSPCLPIHQMMCVKKLVMPYKNFVIEGANESMLNLLI